MISRRALSGLLMTLVGPASVAGSDTLGLSRCHGSCANVDLPALGYDAFCRSFFDIATAGRLSARATGSALRREMRPLFQQQRLYRPSSNEMQVLWRQAADGFSVVKVEFNLECGLPVRGCLGIPDRGVKGLVLLAHGMASTPERCFADSDPDYMNAIGKQLCEDGYVVWCPYIVQIGNQESQNNIAAMLASHGISAHNVSCASVDAGEIVCRKLTGMSDLNVGVYGASWGAFLALHLEAATGRMRPTVVSGYMRDEQKFLMSPILTRNLGIELASYIHFNTSRAKYVGRELARLIRPCPLFVEVGSRDAANSIPYGRDEKFAEMQSVYAASGHPDLIDMAVFDGIHEVSGKAARPWLQERMTSPAYQITSRLKNVIAL
ncbi:alpha/beta hydrolase [Bradyrhizobium genosp. L]|uniref:alpha/beta hydrolase n=1 Tax=Bradyrhizobium genosp. L TaxID=83637 RepID=UPI0018A260B5|nr:alpha/beta hydrolase [Bradyrhizobium genosp. L]QPF84735.1 alpha/beta hydrolase [Bradyrhizobium genosp. L]